MPNGTPIQTPAPSREPAWIAGPARLPQPTDRTPLGIDTEFMRRNTFHPRLALVQVAHQDDCWLIDPLAYDAATDLRPLVAGRVCVMHSASEDLEALAPVLDDTPLDLFDTQIAAALCGFGPGLSYQHLVDELLHVSIPKDETRSDWLQRPLTAGQLQYAAQDVTFLAPLHAKLAAELQRQGRSEWHAEDCARLVERRHPAIDPDPQRTFSTASEWRPEAQLRLKRELRWRDATARKLDKPRPWILDDPHALAFAHDPPATAEELYARAKGVRALRGPQRAELLAVLQAPPTPGELDALAPILPSPHGETRRAVDAMRSVVQAVAKRANLPAGVLCPRRLIEEFAVSHVWPAGLHGWRAGLLEAELTARLPS